jgi:hypothetical protein
MTRISVPMSLVLLLTAILTTMLWPASPSWAGEDTASLTINRLVICSGIENREPVDSVSVFPAGTEMAYAFLEATDISRDVEVSIVWLHEGNDVARVILPIRQGSHWRTYSSKKLAGRSGSWRVEVQDSNAAVLAATDFKVE